MKARVTKLDEAERAESGDESGVEFEEGVETEG
jgi:hypothetical protein